MSTPQGITPPSPGLEREEPDLWQEDDIPSDDGGPAASEGREREGREDRKEGPRKVERE